MRGPSTSRCRQWSPVLLALAGLASCTSPGPVADFDSSDPRERTLAAIDSWTARDESALPELVEMLDSRDVTTRMIAAVVLRDLTGSELGFDAYGPEHERASAIRAWERLVAERAQTSPVVPMEDVR